MVSTESIRLRAACPSSLVPQGGGPHLLRFALERSHPPRGGRRRGKIDLGQRQLNDSQASFVKRQSLDHLVEEFVREFGTSEEM
jgi:hypothetical protein